MNASVFDQATSPDWLTAQLLTNGYMHSGKVVRVQSAICSYIGDGTTYTARFYHLDIDYAPGSEGICPGKMLLKLSKQRLFE